MEKFVVKIDLSTFFEDERKHVLVLADPKWNNVEMLQNRVKQIFDVDSVQFLSSDGFFIPPLESIEVVKSLDIVKYVVHLFTFVIS